MTSSMSWNATPIARRTRSTGTLVLLWGVGERDRHLRRCRDERPGLVAQHLQVVVESGPRRLRPDGLVQLAEHEPLEELRLQRMARSPMARDQLAGAREQQVAGEDRDGVAPHVLRREGTPRRSAASSMHVVVVQRADVQDLDGLRRRHDVVRDPVAELRGEQREHRAHPLAAGREEVAPADVRDLVVEGDLLEDAGLDAARGPRRCGPPSAVLAPWRRTADR